MVAIIYSDRFLDHLTGLGHPECPQRLTAIVDALRAAPWGDRLTWHFPTPLTERDPLPWIAQLHDPQYLELLQHLAQRPGGGALDLDTPVSPQSYDVALLAVNAWLDGVDFALRDQPAFVVARPPGHHATARMGMGFCLLSNGAIAAHYALSQPEINRVAILDWDVHHGNGTQDLIENNEAICYCSLHQSPAYPGTGHASDRGNYDNVLNIPVPPNSLFPTYQAAFTEQVIPFFRQFRPDLLIISAGYDALHADPLASMCLQPTDFAKLTQQIRPLAPRLFFGLEGGYDLPALGAAVVATLGVLV